MSGVSKIQGQRQRLRHRNDRPEELLDVKEELTEENYPEVSTTTTEASDEEVEEKTCWSERL